MLLYLDPETVEKFTQAPHGWAHLLYYCAPAPRRLVLKLHAGLQLGELSGQVVRVVRYHKEKCQFARPENRDRLHQTYEIAGVCEDVKPTTPGVMSLKQAFEQAPHDRERDPETPAEANRRALRDLGHGRWPRNWPR